MRYPFRPLSVAVAAAVLFAAVGARAATFTVTTLADSGAGSLRQAIADANAAAGADEIVFAGGLVGSVELASALPTVSESLTLTGPGPEALRIDANQHHQVLTLWGVPGNVFAISGVTLTGGLASEEGGGVFLAEQQTLTLEDVHLVDNAARDGELRFWGGGLFASSGTVVTIRRTLVAGNEGSVGGGIYMGGTSLLVEQSAIVRNRAIFEGEVSGSVPATRR